MQEPANNSIEQKRYFRLIVGSANEAVSLIQKKFGTGATVQSVKQHKPKGVNKLWSSPKLEIVVCITPETQAKEPFKLKEEPQKTKKDSEQISSEEAIPEMVDVTASQKTNQIPTIEKPKEQTPLTTPAQESKNEEMLPKSNLGLEEILTQSQFDATIIQRLKALPKWDNIRNKSIKQGLTEIITHLREEFITAQNKEIGPFAAFVGTSGVGKSTVLRKYVTNRVFVHGKKVQILKLDDEDPNPDDMLNVFCELIGINLVRDPQDLQLGSETELYVDVPGVSRNNPEQIQQFKSILDKLNIESRIMVMNSLYDQQTLSQTYEIARKYNATHQIFTHLDELETWSKLWKFVLKGSLPLMFINMGAETSSAAREEFLPLLINKTFPSILLN